MEPLADSQAMPMVPVEVAALGVVVAEVLAVAAPAPPAPPTPGPAVRPPA